MKRFPTCTYPLFLIPLLILSSIIHAQITDEETSFYMQRGIIPFVDQLQDGDYSQAIYLVPHDLTVEKGKVMTILPGSTLLFKKDTKIIVEGKLVLKGAPDKRIVLKRLDNDMYMNPFTSDLETRWDGVYIRDGGELEASYTHISDSKFGFSSSRKATIFLLDSVLFVNNKYQNVTVGSESISIVDNEYTFYKLEQPDLKPIAEIYIDTVKLPTQQIQIIEQKPKASKRLIRTRVTMASIAIGGAILAGGSYYINDFYYDKYKKKNNWGVDDPKRVAKYETYSKVGLAGFITGSTLAAIGASGFALTFLF